jgi:RNA polymerase sigma-70 factor (ECF subfamily)
LTVAKNRRTDQARRDARLVITDEANDMADAQAIEPEEAQLDERLKLMFVCAHPAIDEKIRTPLMLQTVLGLEAEQIAEAFLVSPSAMAQRLVRAKKKIKVGRHPLCRARARGLPRPDGRRAGGGLRRLCRRLAGGGGDLSHEAFFLSTILADLAPENPEALGLTALIGFIEARRDARVQDGVLVPVPEQDTALWDTRLIDRSASLLSPRRRKKDTRPLSAGGGHSGRARRPFGQRKDRLAGAVATLSRADAQLSLHRRRRQPRRCGGRGCGPGRGAEDARPHRP